MKAGACMAVFLAGLIPPAGVRSGEPLSEWQLVREALAENPVLKASTAKWAAMKERVPQAKAWDDPMIGVDFERMGTTRFDTYSGAEWMVAQKLPEIAAVEQRLKAEEARVQRARREWIPEPQVRVEARHFRGNSETFTEFDTGIFFSIPWANPGKYSAGVREAQQMAEMARREIEAERTAALGLLRDQLRKIGTLRRQYDLSTAKLVPLARQTEATLQINYQADSASFIELLTAQKVLRETEAAASTQLAEYLAALAELEAIVGGDPAETASPKTVTAPAKGRKP